jgi:hypothetical membrane protein
LSVAILDFLIPIYPYFGLAGCAIIVVAVIVTGLSYRGKRGEPYSVFNHFISELGERGVSDRADVFNVGLIAAGLLLIPFSLGLGTEVGGVWALLGGLAGVITAMACAFVGIFPMNNLSAHTIAAMTYFRSGLLMVLFFTLAIALQPAERTVVPKLSFLFGLLTCTAYIAFLALLRGGNVSQQIADSFNPEALPERPSYWAIPAVEWAVFFSTVVWFFALAIFVA